MAIFDGGPVGGTVVVRAAVFSAICWHPHSQPPQRLAVRAFGDVDNNFRHYNLVTEPVPPQWQRGQSCCEAQCRKRARPRNTKPLAVNGMLVQKVSDVLDAGAEGLCDILTDTRLLSWLDGPQRPDPAPRDPSRQS